MIPGADLAALDATAQAELVRHGEVSPVELATAAAERLEAVEPDLNAVVVPLPDQAVRGAASAPPGPFQGVPILLKDFLAAQKGVPYYAGTRFLRDASWVADHDAFLVERLRAAGMVFLGRTSTPELAMSPLTRSTAFGATRNPWDPARSPGGSSGGSAAAVAAAIVAVAHGSDGGGSLRMPASACGVIGLKPSRGRISMGPEGLERAAVAAVEGFLTRSVRDAAAMLDVASGGMPGDPCVAPPPARAFADALAGPVPRLRVRLLTESFNGAAVDPACAEAAVATGRLLESLGHRVDTIHRTPITDPRLAEHGGVRAAVLAAGTLATWGARLGRPLGERDVEPATWEMAERGRAVSAERYAIAITEAQARARRIHLWWEDFDLLLTPTLACTPTRIEPDATSLAELVRRAAPWRAFAPPFNFTGQPAVSLPVARSDDGLPIGVQLVARYGREDLLLGVAAELEQAVPWAHERPRIWAGHNTNGGRDE
ncbi:amidase [Actinomadura madurae]|uniref:amidase n=1 Tax=Actinomadura madurae TaxID=1993 RepID=UPI00202761E4|nr:amidase [Actinomadura madurae]MCP9980677.1 amidase [Actinomadura madurae]URN07715.1 amidase [Actinomadura madurae]